MKKISLLEFLETDNNCLFCKSPLVFRMSWHYSRLKQSCSISEDGVFKYNNVSIALTGDKVDNYWLGDDFRKFYSVDEEKRQSDNYTFIKECYKCVHRFSIHSSGLMFEHGFVDKIGIEEIRFQVNVNDKENYIVTQDFSHDKTKVVFSKLKDVYSGILLPDNKSLEMPLIKFNFDDPETIIDKIKTFTLLS